MGGAKKFVVFGLDNSGKTAIVHSLKGEGNLLSMCTFNPTVGVKIETVETPAAQFRIWDFGGQDRYRQKHLEEIDENLAQASKIIYVIDVQDAARYDESLAYLAAIIDHVEEPASTDISIFLHKADPPSLLASSQDWGEQVPVLLDRLRTLLPQHLNVKIFKTSVYTVFHKVPVI